MSMSFPDIQELIMGSEEKKDVQEMLERSDNSQMFYTTGGGAQLYDKFIKGLDIGHRSTDEIQALIRGIDFMIQNNRHEAYYLTDYDINDRVLHSHPYGKIEYPYIVVNIGSGVSVVKVTGPGEFERIGGISIGGGTFIGLSKLLTGIDDFEQYIEMAHSGDSDTVDLLVRDIYGGDYQAINLSGDIVASSFGKVPRLGEEVDKKDAVRSLLVMITYIVASLANLYAQKITDTREDIEILYVGNFLYKNIISKKKLAHATNFWSKGKTPALFLEHEGFFGAVGSLCQ